eukprot:gnl/TRDRNA2_/TRDRNA2_202662_c0_seq1.p1 gnl/TRDRNA2_/TRDRNA2_202662_c0~~gnl/TRDRNA2_/TRDRNA2_202662_c0_seq1.p1  ORF type:complete len:190 (-),score=25.95 gnl/TRDRNA2_/TRDRNA2_202662_c0_seq1:37-606(-)
MADPRASWGRVDGPRGFDRGAPTPVVPMSHQDKQVNQGPPWLCTCGHPNEMVRTHCGDCGNLRPDERAARAMARAGAGLGKGGGYMERDVTATQRNEVAVEMESKKSHYDEYGRFRGGAEGSESKPTSKAERQRLALERLKGKRPRSPSPVRGRQMSSRSRSRQAREREREKEKKRQRTGGFILSGGLR